MTLAETLRGIAEESSMSEIELAPYLCAGFANRVCAGQKPRKNLGTCGRLHRSNACVFRTNVEPLV
jgi:hypothetical protein